MNLYEFATQPGSIKMEIAWHVLNNTGYASYPNSADCTTEEQFGYFYLHPEGFGLSLYSAIREGKFKDENELRMYCLFVWWATQP